MTASEVCAGTIYGEHERRMLDRHGLRPSTARPCLRVVLGKRCVMHHSGDHTCLCQTVQQRQQEPLFDHVHIWLDREGCHVLTNEPYDATPEDIQTFTADMAALGIAVDRACETADRAEVLCARFATLVDEAAAANTMLKVSAELRLLDRQVIDLLARISLTEPVKSERHVRAVRARWDRTPQWPA